MNELMIEFWWNKMTTKWKWNCKIFGKVWLEPKESGLNFTLNCSKINLAWRWNHEVLYKKMKMKICDKNLRGYNKKLNWHDRSSIEIIKRIRLKLYIMVSCRVQYSVDDFETFLQYTSFFWEMKEWNAILRIFSETFEL
jgi:hypothetical protein